MLYTYQNDMTMAVWCLSFHTMFPIPLKGLSKKSVKESDCLAVSTDLRHHCGVENCHVTDVLIALITDIQFHRHFRRHTCLTPRVHGAEVGAACFCMGDDISAILVSYILHIAV